ncbi:McrC family protein [Pseudoalteromonas sp. T1lg88]|uniref:McrC family protein n=1 Tax=Pseudoalteromonas sp. T1lg88 TaxID=2077104 RepID=UPI000CF603DB|nr:McrC family protein [Pseudoalteromonas sp. T1lg88]
MRSSALDISVREFAILTNNGKEQGLDCQSIPSSAFLWLLENGVSHDDSQRELVRVKRYGRSIALQVVNYVGVLETPCGARIEILPKISKSTDNQESTRQVLLKMLAMVENLELKQYSSSHLQLTKQPLYEVLISYFLHSVSKLIKQGVRYEYQRKDKNSPFLRGRLNLSKQLSQRPGKGSEFHINVDVYTPDRAENKLIHAALKQVLKWTKSDANRRLGRELLFFFHEIDISTNYEQDFRLWRDDRTLAHYRPLKPWCELILSYRSPISMVGKHRGISFLFPMETLFERYVAKQLSIQIPKSFSLKQQVRHLGLTEHKGDVWFRLQPDFVIYDGSRAVSVLDTKWKLINESLSNTSDKYHLSQADIYQLFAYGEKYLKGRGELYLIYPSHAGFSTSLESFNYKDDLKLNVVPYDLVNDTCPIALG